MIALIALPIIGYCLACVLIAPIISRKITDALSQRLRVEVQFDSLSYRFPYSVHLKHLQMHSDASQGHVMLLQMDRLDLTLAQIPRSGRPIVVKNLELTNPVVHFVQTPAGVIGSKGASIAQNTPASAPAPERKLSEMFELRRFKIINGKIRYENAGDPDGGESFDGINIDLGVTQKSKALYSYHVASNGGERVSLDAAGTCDIDQMLLNVDQFKTTAEREVGWAWPTNSKRWAMPTLLDGVRGSAEVTGKGVVPLRDLSHSQFSCEFKLHDGAATLGGDQYPITGLEVSASIDRPAAPAATTIQLKQFHATCASNLLRINPFSTTINGDAMAVLNLKLTLGNDQWILNGAQFARDPVDHHVIINNIAGQVIFASPRAIYPGGMGRVFKQFGPIGLYTINGSADFHRPPSTQPTIDLAIDTNGSSATLSSYNIPATNIVGQMRLTNTAAEIKHIEGDTLNGKIAAHGVAVLVSPHGYEGELTANSIDMEHLARAMAIGESGHGKLSGRADLMMKFDGKAARDALTSKSTLNADGRLEITDGQLWEIPVLTDIVGQTGVKRDALVASSAAAVFHIENELIRLHHAAINSSVLGLQGSGDVGFNKIVDLDIIAAPLGDWKENLKRTNIPIVSDVVGEVAGGIERMLGAATSKLLYEFHVTGAVANPDIHPIAAPVLTKNAEVVFGKMLREMKEHELLNLMGD